MKTNPNAVYQSHARSQKILGIGNDAKECAKTNSQGTKKPLNISMSWWACLFFVIGVHGFGGALGRVELEICQ
jgi:hypothetical protein